MSYSVACFKCGKERTFASKYSAKNAEEKKTQCFSCRSVANNKARKGSAAKERNPAWCGYKDIPGKVLSRARNGAINRNLCFEITLQDLDVLFEKQGRVCALTGVHLTWGVDASIDRIDSSIGYTVDNIQIIHKDVNMMKRDFSQQRFLEICSLVHYKGLQ